jgi:hypothetical protein
VYNDGRNLELTTNLHEISKASKNIKIVSKVCHIS